MQLQLGLLGPLQVELFLASSKSRSCTITTSNRALVTLKRLKHLDSNAALLLVNLSHVPQGVDSFFVATTVDEILWCLTEVENKEAKDKDE